uniref:Uncharacterized protein n=1 Tax=Anguilla anguilla TaxID=7936 RepID=A0A0E9TUM3_ANGAN
MTHGNRQDRYLKKVTVCRQCSDRHCKPTLRKDLHRNR